LRREKIKCVIKPKILLKKRKNLKKNLPLAKSHWERRKRLEELESVDPEIEDFWLTDRFSARDHHFHEQGFYEGILDPAMVKIKLKKVERYIDDITGL
jgi:hypothetical protein